MRVVAKSVSKSYRIGGGLGGLVRRLAGRGAASREVHALSNVSLEVAPGEALGVVGANGAGKTTLLRVLSGVTTPTSGSVQVPRRVVPLLELSAGFHPELSGRDNVFLNGALYGMRRTEIATKLDEITAFADVARFLDVPVKKYSSGMVARLAFATAIFSEPELLLVDEVLSVGDLAFALKAQRAIAKLRASGVPIVFVSHNLQQVRNACDRAIWLDAGAMRAEGRVDDVLTAYARAMYQGDGDVADSEAFRVHTDPTVAIARVTVVDDAGQSPAVFATGSPICVRIRYETARATGPLRFHLGVYDAETGALLVDHNSADDGFAHPGQSGPGAGVAVMRLGRQPFHAGRYRVSAIVTELHATDVADWHEKLYGFSVAGGRVGYGTFHAFPEWRFEPEEASRGDA